MPYPHQRERNIQTAQPVEFLGAARVAPVVQRLSTSILLTDVFTLSGAKTRSLEAEKRQIVRKLEEVKIP